MPLGLSEPLPSLVANRFAAARDSGALVFSATQLAVLSPSASAGIHYQLRYCPSLAKKPVPTTKDAEQERKGPKPDPFENPSKDLLIAEIPPPPFSSSSSRPDADAQDNGAGGHVLVLNKFPVIPRHFILATKQFRRQTDLLEKEDLEVAFACIQAWNNPHHQSQDETQKGEEKRLFAFYNSGSESGASQPHRHLQFLPVEDMHGQHDSESELESESESEWIPLIDHVATSNETVITDSGLRYLPSLAFKHFVFPLPLSPSPSSETLYQAYLSLYRAAAAVDAVSSSGAGAGAAENLAESGPAAAISYNLAMTESAMMICPRRSETAYLSQKEGVGAGKIALNGTILAGTLMVKQESEWEELRNEPQKIELLLADVGVSNTSISGHL